MNDVCATVGKTKQKYKGTGFGIQPYVSCSQSGHSVDAGRLTSEHFEILISDKFE